MLNKKYVTNENYTELLLAHTQSVSLNQQNREEVFFLTTLKKTVDW